MDLRGFPFSVTNWAQVSPTLHPGEHGVTTWRTRHFGDIRVRMVDYSPGYVADHWCEKGHVVLCLAGELITDLKDAFAPSAANPAAPSAANPAASHGAAPQAPAAPIRSITLTPGMSYQVADPANGQSQPHRSRSPLGCRLFIVD